MAKQEGPYASDRWITPGVITAGIIVVGLVVAVVAAGVTYLTARGIDPDPMLKLVTTLAAALGSLGNFVLLLAGRTPQAKVERNTGQLAAGVGAVVEVLDAPPAKAPAPRVDERLADEPPPTAAAPAYVVDLDDDPATGTFARVSVPPIPNYPRHRRTQR